MGAHNHLGFGLYGVGCRVSGVGVGVGVGCRVGGHVLLRQDVVMSRSICRHVPIYGSWCLPSTHAASRDACTVCMSCSNSCSIASGMLALHACLACLAASHDGNRMPYKHPTQARAPAVMLAATHNPHQHRNTPRSLQRSSASTTSPIS
jgi:hypothetical protein